MKRKPKPLIRMKGVSVRLDGKTAFHNLDWQLERNQHWAIVGPNGSGKTLFVRLLAGELPHAGGEIDFNFRLPSDGAPEDRVVLLSFEQQKAFAGDAPAALRWFSAEQDAAVSVSRFLSQDWVEEINPFEVKHRSRKDRESFQRSRRATTRVLGIEELMSRRLPSLSNGEMRKILLARALLKRPRVLVLEDVFTGLDAGFRAHLRALLEKLLRRSSVRFVLTAPAIDALPSGVTHLLCLDRRRVVAAGRIQPLLRDARVRALFAPPASPRTSGRRRVAGARRRRNRPEAAELVRMEKVSVRYGRKAVLSEIDWIVRQGESWALIGPNGSGKSTLLSLVSGDNPQGYGNDIVLSGHARGGGESIWELKRRIGSVSSELHLHFPEEQSCLETVVSGFHDWSARFGRGTPAQRAAASRLLARLGLRRRERQSFGSLSEGLQRMVLLARALVKSPDLLLLDEPCQGLDAVHRKRFLGIIDDLLDRGRQTIIYVTHVPEEVPRGIRNVLRLAQGRIHSVRTIDR